MKTTKQPARWIPGAERRAAALRDGRLVRFHKRTGTVNGKKDPGPPFTVITPKGPEHPLTIKGRTKPAAWWICAAYHGNPPTAPDGRPARVEFKNGNRADLRPINLTWSLPAATHKQRSQEAMLKHLSRPGGRFLPIQQAPGYFCRDDGTIHKVTSTGDTKQIRGTLNRKTGTVQVKLPNVGTVHLASLVFDIWSPSPLPGPYARAELIDARDPWNTHPNNLRVSVNTRTKPRRHNFRPQNRDPLPNPHETQNERQNTAQREIRTLMDELETAGARQLSNSPRVWITPDGYAATLDPANGRHGITYARPLANCTPARRGTVKTPAGIIDLFLAVSDAFNGTKYAPNLPHPAPTFGRARPLDGDWANPHPSNIGYTAATSKTSRTIYTFKDNNLQLAENKSK